MRLAAKLIVGGEHRVLAGPLVLWDDGIVYAICNWGGTDIPPATSPAILIEALEQAGRKVVKIKDETVIGGWLSGPVYSKGPASISGWSEAWTHNKNRQHVFTVYPPEMLDNVIEISRFYLQ